MSRRISWLSLPFVHLMLPCLLLICVLMFFFPVDWWSWLRISLPAEEDKGTLIISFFRISHLMAWVCSFYAHVCTFLAFLVFFLTSSPCYGWLLLPSVSSHCMSHVLFLFFFPFCVLSHLCFTCPVKFPAPVITRLCSNVLHLRVIASPRLFCIEAPVSSFPLVFFFARSFRPLCAFSSFPRFLL